MKQIQQKSNTDLAAVSYRGLISKVAAKLNKSQSLVSMVNSGKAKSAKVSAELDRERERMRRKQERVA